MNVLKNLIQEEVEKKLSEAVKDYVWFDVSKMKDHAYDRIDGLDTVNKTGKSIYRHAATADVGTEDEKRPDHHLGVPAHMTDLHSYMVRNGAKRLK